jgi:hypothetical protein
MPSPNPQIFDGKLFLVGNKAFILLTTTIIMLCGPGCLAYPDKSETDTGHESVAMKNTTNSIRQEQTEKTPVNSADIGVLSPCGINLSVTGGQFSPGRCVFEIITPGPPCGPNTACPPDYALSMKGGNRPHILEVSLINFKESKRRTYHFNPAQNLRDFNGYALDGNAIVRNLLKGEIALEPIVHKPDVSGNVVQTVKVLFDVSFANGINIRGSGEVPVKHVSAP